MNCAPVLRRRGDGVSEKSTFSLVLWLRFQVAAFAMRFCGPEVLYWTAPTVWEEYMSVGEPYKGG